MKYNIDFKPCNLGTGLYGVQFIIKPMDGMNNEFVMEMPGHTFLSEDRALEYINKNRAILLSEVGLLLNNSDILNKKIEQEKKSSPSTRTVKVDIPDAMENFKYHIVYEEGKYYARVTYLDHKYVLRDHPFDTRNDARNFIRTEHKNYEKTFVSGLTKNNGSEKKNNEPKKIVIKKTTTKVDIPNLDDRFGYNIVTRSDGKSYIEVRYLTDYEIIESMPFDTKEAARDYVLANHEKIEKTVLKNVGDTNKGTDKKEKDKKESDDIIEVTVPDQNKNVKYFVVKNFDAYCDFYFVRVHLLDLDKNIDFSRKFYDKEEVIDYIKKNHTRLAEDAVEMANNNKTVRSNTNNNNESENKDKRARIIGKLCIFGAGALTAAVLIGSCHSCAKGCNTATCSPSATVRITASPKPEPTEAPVVTSSPVPTQEAILTFAPIAITTDYIDEMSEDVLKGYMDSNSSFGSINNGGISGSTITASDIKNAIAILNIDELSINNYDTFRSIVSDKQPDAFLNEADYVMQNLMANNLQTYAMKKYDPNSDKKLEGLLWLSPMLIDEDDRKDMQLVEEKIENIMQADLNGDRDSVETISEELRDMLNSQPMKNRGNGFDRALYHELEVVLNCANNTMTEDVYNNLASIKETERESTYVGIMNILSNVNEYGCYANNGVVIDSTLVRTRHA